jgi:hypothetical protein
VKCSLIDEYVKKPSTHGTSTFNGSSVLSEFMRIAEIAITTILANIKDERTFSSLKFIRNCLEGNLDTVVRVFSQGYYNLESFLYANAYKQW